MSRLSTLTVLWLLTAAGCSKLVDVDVGAGLGATCSRDEECQASSCLDGICTRACGDSAGCPGGTVCTAGLCELPVSAGFIYPYPPSQDALAKIVEDARGELQIRRPEVTSAAVSDAPLTADAVARAASFRAGGAELFVVSSPTHGDGMVSFATENPSVTVLAFGAPRARENVVSFDVRAYQAYYLAGIAAARTSATKRLGMLGSIPSPLVVSRINGFVAGARKEDPSVVVEVVWMNAWHDMTTPQNGMTRERVETEALVARGADVIAHVLDNNIAAITVGDLVEDGVADAYAVAVGEPDACDNLPPGRCIGSLYYRFGPLISELVRDRARARLTGGFVLRGLSLSESDSAFGFTVGAGLSGGPVLATELDGVRTSLAQEAGVGAVFAGPILSAQCTVETGDDPCVAAGEVLSDAGLASMCWFLDGVVAFDGAADAPAAVPATCRDWLP